MSHRSHCQNFYPDVVCRGNFKLQHYDPPLLYDLHSDPSELYNLSVTDYQDVMTQINKVDLYSACDVLLHNTVSHDVHMLIAQLKKEFEDKMVWGESQIGMGHNSAAEPCAKPGCKPFPTCCKTTSLEQRLDLDTTSRVIP